MEPRKIVFILTNSSSQKTLMSSAETLGQLKADMRNAEIDYRNMAFYEGRTRVELLDDSSLLPTNIPIPAKGTTPASVTNDLVFMLSTVNKKISSGALSDERKKLLEIVKSKNLKFEVMKRFGKNATQVKSHELKAFLEEFETTSEKTKKVKEVKVKVVKEKVKEVVVEDANDNFNDIEIKPDTKNQTVAIENTKIRNILGKLIDILSYEESLDGDYNNLLTELTDEFTDNTEVNKPSEETENIMSQREIDNMFDWMK